jgi:hypothetical protein
MKTLRKPAAIHKSHTRDATDKHKPAAADENLKTRVM